MEKCAEEDILLKKLGNVRERRTNEEIYALYKELKLANVI